MLEGPQGNALLCHTLVVEGVPALMLCARSGRHHSQTGMYAVGGSVGRLWPRIEQVMPVEMVLNLCRGTVD
jgi:hypothetical protein